MVIEILDALIAIGGARGSAVEAMETKAGPSSSGQESANPPEDVNTTAADMDMDAGPSGTAQSHLSQSERLPSRGTDDFLRSRGPQVLLPLNTPLLVEQASSAGMLVTDIAPATLD